MSTTAARSLATTLINNNTTADITPDDVRTVFAATFDAIDAGGGGSAVTPNVQTGTAYTLTSSDGFVAFTGSGAITLTLPNNLPTGFRCTVAQIGAGQVTFSAASGAAIVSVQSLVKTALTGSGAELYVYQNAGGTAARYWLAGDLAA